ncbi:hypothetical protein [Nocardia transvalensis]|uniref:hypothetical protein n=1 Tax=Nocardia transvalensis TaxID=37333 RepID=UPI0018949274|nr:hypothetical protein [Nocardia transvalensis]MBF6328749.1 hypothetical protein [Nocardia transvalensis]
MAVLYRKHVPQPQPNPLQRFNLTQAEVHDRIIRPAVHDAENANPLSPPGTPGQRMHQAAVAFLRELLIPRDWKIDQNDGVARTVNPERGLAIVVAAGNEFTGLAGTDDELTTKWPKGHCALAKTRCVADGFDAIDPDFPASDTAVGLWDVWYLLHRPDADEIRIELSAPTYLDKSKYPRGWRERIILDPLDLTPTVDIDPGPDDEDDDQGNVDVPVPPK